MNNTGQSGGTPDADIDAPEVWDVETGKSSIIIGILDSGTDWTHEDLGPGTGSNNYSNIWLNPGEDAWIDPNNPNSGNGIDNDGNGFIDDWKGWDFHNNNNDSRGPFWHGTHVAGIASAKTNNGGGISGIAGGWGAQGSRLMTLGVGDFSPNGSILDDAILYAASMGANIIQMSLSVGQSSAIDAALQAAYQTYGVFIDCAAGNTSGGSVTYPATNQYVFAVTATDHNDLWATYSGKGPEVDVSAPGSDILSTVLNNSYDYASGTSMAAPHTAGIAALIWSANPNLTNAQVADIIRQTADDKGTPGWDEYYGWGRVNANQAVLLALAYSNKSSNPSATAYNNNHILERGFFGRLHEVFHSGGEIFYRRSSDNGTSWELTTRLSGGNSNNLIPSIVAGYNGSTDILCAVWQRKIDNYNYEIYTRFSSNMGTTWLSAPAPINVTVSWNQSNGNYGPGPTPVIASYFRGGAEGVPSYLLVYATENGLYYRTAITYSSGWSAANVVPGSYGSGSNIWFPSVASYNSQDYHVNLVYGVRFGSPHIYSQIFYEDGTWTNRVAIDWLGTYNRYPSLAVDYARNLLGVWSGWNGNNYDIRFRQGFSDGTWSSWAKVWSITSNDCFLPVITYYNKGGNYPYGIDILWHTTPSKQIRQKKYYGIGDNWIPADPSTDLVAYMKLYPNITHDRQNTSLPKQIWTDQVTPPIYSVLVNSIGLPKEELFAGGEIYRAAVINNASDNSVLTVEISQPVIKLNNGEEVAVKFKEYDYTQKLELSLSNVFDYLQTEPVYIPNNANEIRFKVNINSTQPDTLSNGSINTNLQTQFRGINFGLIVKNNSSNIVLGNAGTQVLNNNSGIHNFSNEFTMNVSTLRGKNIYLIPGISVTGSFNQNSLHFSLVNKSVEYGVFGKDSSEIAESNTKPTEYGLEQNFPNPFNPVTQIRYSIPQDGFVILKVFDILGREITTLINEEKSAGSYLVNFDASQLASGIYFYSITSGSFSQTRKMILAK